MAINPLNRFWYGDTIARFSTAPVQSIMGSLSIANPLDDTREQRIAWQQQVELLRPEIHDLDGVIFLEFDIPRIGRRIDVVLIVRSVIFVIEFKVGAKIFDRSAINQVWDYALDLKNFHETSHDASLVPIVVATEAIDTRPLRLEFAEDGVAVPIEARPSDLRFVINHVLASSAGALIDTTRWIRGNYRPTPTIIEAAKALYANHTVDEIARNDADTVNLRITSHRIEELIDDARARNRKLICFLTGVPGAGKTLVGLDVATRREKKNSLTHAVFLSGNGPLVAVLRAALVRDESERRRQRGEKRPKNRDANPVKSFIQNVHHFRDAALTDRDAPPVDRVAIFDEAQRAWNLVKTRDFMKRRKSQPDFNFSEPAFLISYMDRHPDWAVIVCLVGGGQEIHTGEGGISEWLDAVNSQYPHWDLYISSRLSDTEYAAGQALEIALQNPRTQLEDSLHLAVSMRSFRAENLSSFVKFLLDREELEARAHLAQLKGRYPICITRSIERAKAWVRSRARGTEHFGLLASSKAVRLKPYAIDVRVDTDPVHWFLGDATDIRSSQYLEDVATEFQVQGLELDWTIVNWDGDLRATGHEWAYHDFRGQKWQRVKKEENQLYLKNAYRVLLTRARQGMVIFVPPGDDSDPTRPSSYYDPTYKYLKGLGLAEL